MFTLLCETNMADAIKEVGGGICSVLMILGILYFMTKD